MELVNKNMKIAVLTGGIGPERDISLQSGQCVSEALLSASFNVVTVDIQPDNLDILQDNTIDVFFPALHGEFGEDGRLQQILKDKSLVYAGSGPTASKLAFDKIASKKLFSKAGVTTPEAVVFNTDSDINQIETRLKYFKDGYVIKPINQGSSVGVRIITDPQQVFSTANQILNEFGDCMIEQFIPGREITVGILKEKTLPIIEILSKTDFYDYQAKYIDEHTEYLFDTIKDTDLVARIEQMAMDCFCALGCRHFARVDFILSEQTIPYVLEVNTIPGFTTHSLLPKAAAKVGLSMSDLCAKIVEAAHSSLIRH
jgi:D-alanine-D-alanine ligase